MSATAPALTAGPTPAPASCPDRAEPIRITFDRRFDAEAAPILRRRLLDLVGPGGTRLTVDLADVETLDAAGVAVLSRVLTEARRRGGDVALVPPRDPAARRILDLTGLIPLFARPENPAA